MAEPGEASRLAERVEALEREVQRLKREQADTERELAAARERVRVLEAAREAAINRIDWAIDSLHTILEQSS
jgi:predicted RNase H-like nuclease (RuvC/YqgF family)